MSGRTMSEVVYAWRTVHPVTRELANERPVALEVSARRSYELAEKAARAGCPMLVAISAATTRAVQRAAAAGLTLLTLARSDSVLFMSDPHALMEGTEDGF